MTGISILLMEDHDALRTAMSRGLTRAGFLVREAATATDALELFAGGARVDLVVADLVVPGRDNNLLIARLRRAAAGIPVIYVSGYPREEAEQRFDFPAGAPFLTKPFELPQLVDAIRGLLPDPVPPGAA